MGLHRTLISSTLRVYVIYSGFMLILI